MGTRVAVGARRRCRDHRVAGARSARNPVARRGLLSGRELADPDGDDEADSAGVAVFGCPGTFGLLEDVTPAPSWPRGMMREILASEQRSWLKLETLAITAPVPTGGSSGD
jgi:hypothetical protein